MNTTVTGTVPVDTIVMGTVPVNTIVKGDCTSENYSEGGLY